MKRILSISLLALCLSAVNTSYAVNKGKTVPAISKGVTTPAIDKDKTAPDRWVIWSAQPARKWEDAFVTGNGRQGTMVFGLPDNERITCVHEELFIRDCDRHLKTVPQTSHLMPEVRRLMDAGKTDAASRLLTDEADRQLREMGAVNRWPVIPHPAFDLCIGGDGQLSVDANRQAIISTNGQSLTGTNRQQPSAQTGNYRRQLNLETGEALVRRTTADGTEIEESVFTSRTDNVNVIRLKALGGKKLNFTLHLEETPGRKGMHFDHNIGTAFRSVESGAEADGWLTYRAAYTKDPGGYEGLARITTKGGKLNRESETLRVTEADEILIVLRITPLEYADRSQMAQAKKELTRLPRKYDQLLTPHAREHGTMFCRMQFDLGCAKDWKNIPTEQMLATVTKQGVTPLFLEQVQAMGRYLLISSCGKYPPPLQGIWGGGWNPAWVGGFVWDSNLNLAISAASMSNLPECAQSYNQYIKSLLPGWRLNAKNYLGYRGFIVAHYNDPETGYLTHFGGSFPWMFWAGGAGWNLRPLYEYAEMTGNDTYLKQEVLPLYREMAELYEDCLVMGSNSLYHISPSISPENAPPGTDTWLSRDATMDVAIAREVFTLLCRMGRQFNLPSAEVAKWEHYLARLPFYRINKDGALAEWVDPSYPDVYNHRHNSHLYPIFPGTELRGCIKEDTDWAKAAGIALDKRFAFDTSSAHGLVHLALQATRLKNTQIAEQNIDRFSRRGYLYNSLITSHEPGHQIYNLDAILSFPRLLMEMLVFTESGRIELLPAWPADYPDGSIKGIRLYGGHTLDLEWKAGKVVNATLLGGSNETLELEYRGEKKSIRTKSGKSIRLDK